MIWHQVGSVVSFPASYLCGPQFESHLGPAQCTWIGFQDSFVCLSLSTRPANLTNQSPWYWYQIQQAGDLLLCKLQLDKHQWPKLNNKTMSASCCTLNFMQVQITKHTYPQIKHYSCLWIPTLMLCKNHINITRGRHWINVPQWSTSTVLGTGTSTDEVKAKFTA